MRLATEPNLGVRGVVLVATFARPPAPRMLSVLAKLGVFHLAPPRFALRALLLGRDAPAELVDDVRAAIASVSPAVLAHRLRSILTESSGDALAQVRVPKMLILPDRDRLVRSYEPSSPRRARHASSGSRGRTSCFSDTPRSARGW